MKHIKKFNESLFRKKEKMKEYDLSGKTEESEHYRAEKNYNDNWAIYYKWSRSSLSSTTGIQGEIKKG
jgi:hypothetical protein